jgi:hypothetical protein
VSLADSVQQEAKIPYLLLDGDRRLYRQFYHVDLGEQQMQALLASATSAKRERGHEN